MPKISIIMPVYNVERFVGRAIESMQAQTLDDFEFLIVNDGSPDKSGEVCDRYAQDDKRIRVFHTANAGAAAARNHALTFAGGEYVYFLDGDDWAEPEMLQEMYDFAQTNNLQYVISGFFIDTYYDDEGGFLQEIKSQPNQVFVSQQEFREAAYRLFDQNLLYPPWNKLYQRQYLEDHKITFPQTLWDDFPFNLLVIENVERVGVLAKPYYHFLRARSDSETAKYNPGMYEKRKEEHQWLINLYTTWGLLEHAPSREMVSRRYVERLLGSVENVTNSACSLSSREARDQIRTMLTDSEAMWSFQYAQPRTMLMTLALLALKHKLTWLTWFEGKVITWVKSSNTKLFATLRSKR